MFGSELKTTLQGPGLSFALPMRNNIVENQRIENKINIFILPLSLRKTFSTFWHSVFPKSAFQIEIFIAFSSYDVVRFLRGLWCLCNMGIYIS